MNFATRVGIVLIALAHKFTVMLALLSLTFICFISPIQAQEQQAEPSPLQQLPWVFGPDEVQLGPKAKIQIPEGFAYLDSAGTQKLNEILQNPPDGVDTFTVAPESLVWIAFFSFSETGYIKDDDKIDANAILASVKAGTEQSNVERRKRGWEGLTVAGWAALPKYDEDLKTLAWAFVAESENTKQRTVNYNTRMLGRRGVMQVVLVVDEAALTSSVHELKTTLGGYQFVAGESYAEYKAGDQVAEYGLAALITGGVAAVAAKKGVFATLGAALAAAWKFVLAGLLAAGAWLKSLLSRKSKDDKAE